MLLIYLTGNAHGRLHTRQRLDRGVPRFFSVEGEDGSRDERGVGFGCSPAWLSAGNVSVILSASRIYCLQNLEHLDLQRKESLHWTKLKIRSNKKGWGGHPILFFLVQNFSLMLCSEFC